MPHHWIQAAIHHVGALHKSLGVPQSQKIPKEALHRAAKRKGKLGARARLALTLESMHHGKK